MALLALLVLVPLPSQELPEYVVKAGFLFNFAKYVQWPDAAFDGPSDPVVVAVVGEDPFGDALVRTLEGKRLGGRSFRIERYAGAGRIGRCHILFVPRTETARLRDVLQAVDGMPVLTVGEDDGFARAGGMAAILIRDRRPALEINREAAGRAGLDLDARLLRLATLVKGP